MITFIKKPEKFSPAGNPVVFQIQTDNPDIVYFRVKVYDVASSAIINQIDIYPTPVLPNGSYVNLSKLLDNVVNWEVNNDSFGLIKPIFKTVRSYTLEITERVLNTTTSTIEDGDSSDGDDDIYHVFNAELARISYSNYLQLKYVVNSGSQVNFLTTKPNNVKVNDLSSEHLYFLQDGSVPFLFVRIKLFNASGVLQQMVTESVTQLDQYKMYRANVSPKSLKDSSNVDFTNVNYYVVDIAGGLGQSRSVERVYYYEELQCWKEYLNVLWVNSLGGIDSYQFTAPQDSIDVSRFQLKKNIYGVNTDGVYSDVNENVFNPSDVIISNQVTTSTRATSKELTDAESYWLQELFISKQVFIEMGDLSLVPALLNNTNYNIPRLRYNRGNLNVISVDFTLADGIIPAGAQAYSSNKSSLEFIDAQMDTIVNNLPGYEITQDEQENNEYNPDQYTHNYK